MKVLVVHNRYRSASPSGEDRVVDQEHDALLAAGHDVRRLERFSDDIARMSSHRKLLVPLQVVWNPAAARDLDRALDAFSPDVVHLHNLFPLLSPSVLRRCHARRVPTVVTVHNYRLVCPGGALFRTGAPCRDCVDLAFPGPGVRHGCYRGSPAATLPIAAGTAAGRRIWRRVPSAYLFLSEAHRREMASLGLTPARTFVKPNFVPAPTRRAEPGRTVAYLGRLTEAKGLHVLVAAWDRYRAHPTRAEPASAEPASAGLRLAVAGTGPMEGQIRRWAAGRPEVEVLGLLDRAACAELVRRCRAVVVPSEWPEPFGLVLAEAMASGVPPIATAHGSFVDMVDDGVDGFLYPPGDAAALAAVLRRVDQAPDELVRAMGEAARLTYRRRFDRSANVARLEAAYHFAIDHPRWRPGRGSPGRPDEGAHRVYQASA